MSGGFVGDSMATIGGSLYADAVHTFFDGLRSYDVERACSVLADDADLQSPWNDGVLTGRDAIQDVLGRLVGNPATRPSFTIQDIRGDGNLVHLDVRMSGRFGHGATPVRISCLHLKGVIHHVMIEGRDGAAVPELPSRPVDLAVKDEPAEEAADEVVAEPKATKAPAQPKVESQAAKDAPMVYIDYGGDVDDIIDVEGIGPVYAKKLNGIGVYTTARLCWESPERIAEATGAQAKTVEGWRAMAQLMKIPGVGGQYAEALYRGGVTGIADLQEKDAEAVADAINDYLASVKTTVQKNKITAKRVAGWKKAAATMQPEELPVPEE